MYKHYVTLNPNNNNMVMSVHTYNSNLIQINYNKLDLNGFQNLEINDDEYLVYSIHLTDQKLIYYNIDTKKFIVKENEVINASRKE